MRFYIQKLPFWEGGFSVTLNKKQFSFSFNEGAERGICFVNQIEKGKFFVYLSIKLFQMWHRLHFLNGKFGYEKSHKIKGDNCWCNPRTETSADGKKTIIHFNNNGSTIYAVEE